MGKTTKRERKGLEKLPAPVWWKELVVGKVGDGRGKSRGQRADLARAVNCDPGMITRLLGPSVRQSELVGPISDHLKIRKPQWLTPEEAEAHELLAAMSPELKATAVRLLKSLKPE